MNRMNAKGLAIRCTIFENWQSRMRTCQWRNSGFGRSANSSNQIINGIQVGIYEMIIKDGFVVAATLEGSFRTITDRRLSEAMADSQKK